MDVSNSTGEDTQYRTGGGTTKVSVSWRTLPAQKVLHCADPKAPWTIYFRLHDGTTLSATYTHPMASVTLVKTKGGGHKINAVRKPVEEPVKPTKPSRTKNAA